MGRKRVFERVAAVVVGMVAGAVVMGGIHTASGLVYPMPEGLSASSTDPAERAAFLAWLGSLPAGAFALAVVAHGLGCMAGAAVATLISGRRSLVPALVVGAVFTVGGIVNATMIPHPAWFPFVDLPAYLVLAYAAGRVLLRPTV